MKDVEKNRYGIKAYKTKKAEIFIIYLLKGIKKNKKIKEKLLKFEK